jgi:predicted nucleotidyltransferase
MENRIGDREILLKSLKEAIEGEEGVLFAYLYGSHACGSALSDSDIDVAVYLNPSDMTEYLKKEKKILSALIDKVHTDRIDLRILNAVPLILQYRVLKEGIPIVVKDEQSRVDFETGVMNRFFDLKPYFDEYKEMLIARIRAGIQE